MRSKFYFLLALVSLAGCGEAWQNLTAPLGGDTAGGRGNVGVIVLNNTPFRAVMTLGSYDQTDPDAEPDFDQFLLEGAEVLDADEDSGVLTFDCARVFSLGGQRLLGLIEARGADADASALIEGIEFFDVDDEDNPVSQGVVVPFEVLLGVDFPCNALLIFKLEVNNDPSTPFRVDYELIPSADSR